MKAQEGQPGINQLAGGVKLRWRTEAEVNNIGFAIYRSEAKGGKYSKIAFVEGAGNSAMPKDYQYLDKVVKMDKAYCYYLEDVEVTGDKGKSQIVVVGSIKAVTWGSLK